MHDLEKEITHESLGELRNKIKYDFFDIVEDYFLIYALTDKILHSFYQHIGEEDSLGGNLEGSQCADLHKLLNFLGFQVKYTDLNSYRYGRLGIILGKLEINKDTKKPTILLENKDRTTEDQERYAIAYLLGCYYMQENIDKGFNVECVEFRVPQSSVEFNADIFAAFLIFTPIQFFTEVNNYYNAKQRQINQEAMLLEMSRYARVPYHFTINSYQYLRAFAGCFYNIHFMKRMKDNLVEIGTSSAEIQRLFKQIWGVKKFIPDILFY